MEKESLVEIYQGENGSLNIRIDDNKQTIWANQNEIAKIFNVNVRTINDHINNIFKSNEMNREATIRKFRLVQKEGNRMVQREIEYYDLDVVLSVGYRVNSKNAIKFRQWANSILHKHIVNGWTINENRIKENYNHFVEAMQNIKDLLPSENLISNNDVLELIKTYANTWFSIDAYDRDSFVEKGKTEQKISLTVKELKQAINQLKKDLIKNNIATELFATERQKDGIESIFGNVMQSFDGGDVYKTTEEKASHLLYFIIKNHPFADGNKRTGAYSFIWFLQQNNILNFNKITPEALTTLTLLIAESNPKDKEKMIGLILELLK